MLIQRGLMALVVLGACAGDDDGGGAGACDAVSACVAEAVTALKACAPTAALVLGTPTNNSGVVENLRCTATDQTVTFSTFSFSATGTVPLPSSTTLATAGTTCGVIKTGTGTRSEGGMSVAYELTTIERPGAASVTINAYEDGNLGVECGTDEEVIATASQLASCAAQIQRPIVTRNADITQMGVQLEDATGAQTELFTCTR